MSNYVKQYLNTEGVNNSEFARKVDLTRMSLNAFKKGTSYKTLPALFKMISKVDDGFCGIEVVFKFKKGSKVKKVKFEA